MSHSGDSRDHYYSAMAQRFEQKKCQLKCQLNTMVDDMFDFFHNEMALVAAANGTAPEPHYPASPTGWAMSSGDCDGDGGGSISGYFPVKVEVTEGETTEMPAAATAFGCLLPEGSSSSLKTDANYMMNQINYQTLFHQSELPSTSSASAVVAATIGNVNNNTRGHDDDETSTSNYDGNKDDDNVIVYSVKCQTCEEIFEDTNQLDVHTLAVHKYRPRRCLVIGCSVSFHDGRSLEEHVRVMHSNKTEFNCKRCRLKYRNHTQLESHFVSAHHLGKFGCGIGGCKYIANNRFDVQYHVNTRHNKSAMHSAQPTTLKRNLTGTRINTTKSNPNRGNNKRKREPTPLMSDFPGCTTVLSSPYNYRHHQRVHTGVRPFICAYPTCEGASFKEKNHCIAHIREVHLNLPRYKNDEKELEIAQDGSEYLKIQHELLD